MITRRLLWIPLSCVLMACGGSSSQSGDANDSIQDVAGQADAQFASTMTPISNMKQSDLPEFAIKAWIVDGVAYWNIYDADKFMQATHIGEEYYRCGDGPFEVSGMDETPIGLMLSKLDKRGHVVLYLIGHERHVYAYDISFEVYGIGGGVGQLPYIENVEKLRVDGTTVYAVNDKGEEQELRFYDEDGPYQFAVSKNGQDYFFELSSTWNMNVTVNSKDHYSGRFHSDGNGAFTYTLSRHYRYNDDYQEIEIKDSSWQGGFRINSNNETITFDADFVGLPQGVAFPYEVSALFG